MIKTDDLKCSVRLNIAVLTGAGISVESGLSTFRGEDGLWLKFDWKKLASAAGFYENPSLVLDFYNQRRLQLSEVLPNSAHCMLAQLEQYHNVCIVTQNVDNLHERAGSTNIIHLHGELSKVTSSDDRLNPLYIENADLTKPILLGDKAKDGTQLRPFVVWFGEYVDSSLMRKAEDAFRKADIVLVIGTSLTVHPAASLIKYAHHAIPKFFIDPGELEDKVPIDVTYIKEKASVGMDRFFEYLSQLTEIYR